MGREGKAEVGHWEGNGKPGMEEIEKTEGGRERMSEV